MNQDKLRSLNIRKKKFICCQFGHAIDNFDRDSSNSRQKTSLLSKNQLFQIYFRFNGEIFCSLVFSSNVFMWFTDACRLQWFNLSEGNELYERTE